MNAIGKFFVHIEAFLELMSHFDIKNRWRFYGVGPQITTQLQIVPANATRSCQYKHVGETCPALPVGVFVWLSRRSCRDRCSVWPGLGGPEGNIGF